MSWLKALRERALVPRAPANAPNVAARSIELAVNAGPGPRAIDYRLVRSLRRTIAIHITQAGVETRAPMTASLADIEAFMRQKQHWIVSRLAEMRSTGPFAWEEGAKLPLLGTHVELVDHPQGRGIVLDGGLLLIGRPARQSAALSGPGPALQRDLQRDWQRRVTAWIKAEALVLYRERSRVLAAELGVEPPQVGLSTAGARWGSCTVGREGARIRVHWKLYLMPPHLVDYVIAHELAHIRELNHSPRFWAQVARIYPEHTAARAELNRLGRALPQL